MTGLFESINLDESFQRTSSRKALTLASKRAQHQFGDFLNVPEAERQTRFSLIAKDLQHLVIDTCQEQGYDDPEGVYHSVVAHLNVAIPKTARRPKMCPYHRELTDMSLTLKDPRAAYEAMTSHQFGPSSCRGQFDQTCNWQPEMVTQEFWDARQQEADQRSQERDMQRAQQPNIPQFDAMPEPEVDYMGPDINDSLESAPTAVGAPEPVMAAKKHRNYEGNVCASCSDGHCSGCNGGACSCGSCGGDGGGGTTAALHQADDKHWIQDAVPKKNKGLLHEKLDVPSDEKIPEDKLEGALHSDSKKEREEAQFAENMKGLHKAAIPGAHDPNYMDPYGGQEEEGYGEEGGLDELIQALSLEYPGMPYEQLMAMAQQEAQKAPESTPIDPNAGWGNGYGNYGDIPGGPGQAPAYASIHEAIKGGRDGDSIQEHMRWPAQDGQDTPTGLSTHSPVEIDRKTWAPHNMPKLDVDKPNGMHNTEHQDITSPTEYKGDAWDKDDGRFDSFKNPTETQDLPAAGDDETRLGDSGFAPNNMDNPQSTGDTWNGMKNQTDPVTTTPDVQVMGSFVSQDEIQRALRAFRG